ncbi:dihydropteroate synthase [Silvibacterium dinghuense]|uniref:dihydropteroate synthase n=2 Tax=Silvibacterium dinghuense TaxID=1560006 RepID=A0A4Q1S9D9_9BACT|nr:dihydropteroate synthase [Silvibacterium dinghuense]
MGILNVTPDSFSDGSRYAAIETALEHALRLLDEGADLLDIGGESTRPGRHPEISAEEEQERILPVIAAVLRERPDTVISVDTYKASTAQAAIQAGAEIINDISGFLWDPAMASVCAETQCGVVLMHTRGRSEEWRSLPPLADDEVAPLVKWDLAARLLAATQAGVTQKHIVLDPGYGFGKSFDENYPLLAHQDALRELRCGLLVGISRKSFLGRRLADLHGGKDAPVEAREHATIAANVAAILAGAHIVRVHAVRPMTEAARIADAILESA